MSKIITSGGTIPLEEKNRLHIQILGKNILQLRRKNNLSQKDMAEKLGIGVYGLSRLERGILPKKLDVAVLFKIEIIFNVNAQDLFKEGQTERS